MKNTLLLIILIIILLGLCYQITQPWVGYFDFNGAAYSRFAKNFLTFGFLKTKMTPTWDMGSRVPERFDYYTHHPPLLAYLVALSFKIFGIQEWSARLVPVVFSVMSLILFYFIVKLLRGESFALLSLVFFGITPMFLYFGRMVNHEAVFLFFYFSIVYIYLRFLSQKKSIYIKGLILCFVLAYLTAWQAFYLSALLLIHYLFFTDKDARDKRMIMALSLLPILFMLFFIGGIYLVKGSLSSNITALLSRFGPNQRHQFSILDFLLLEANRMRFWFSDVMFWLSAFYIVYRLYKKKQFAQEKINIIFLGLPLINIFLFRQAAWEHDYQLYYFLPFLSISCAQGLSLLKDFIPTKKVFQILAALILMLFFIESYCHFMSIHAFKFDIDRLVADKINSVTGADEEIAVNFQISVPTSWYVDRKYTIIHNLAELQELNKEKKFSFVILIPTAGNKSLVAFLMKNYPSFAYKDFIFFNLRTPKY